MCLRVIAQAQSGAGQGGDDSPNRIGAEKPNIEQLANRQRAQFANLGEAVAAQQFRRLLRQFEFLDEGLAIDRP